MKRANDDVKCDPDDEQPARPVATVEHKNAGDDLQEAREMNVPVACEISGHQPTNQRDGAEDNEEPTNDRDRSRAWWHEPLDYTDLWRTLRR